MRLTGVTITGGVSAQKLDIPPTDPFYSSVSLLLHGDGVDNATTFPDNSPNPKTPTVTGVTVDTAIKQFGTGSMEWPNSANSGRLLYADNADFNFGTGDFTIEFFVRFPTVAAEQVVINKGWQSSPNGNAAFLIYLTSGGSLRFNSSSNGGDWNIANERVIVATPTLTANTWTYIAITRSGTTFRAFVNGTIVGAFTFTSALGLFSSSTQELLIGGRVSAGSVSMRGHIDEVRLTKGVARYTASFTTPTEAFPNS